MRAFRLYKRCAKTNRVLGHRDYIGLDNLQKYAPETYKRYDHYDKWDMTLVGHRYVFTSKKDAEQVSYPELWEWDEKLKIRVA